MPSGINWRGYERNNTHCPLRGLTELNIGNILVPRGGHSHWEVYAHARKARVLFLPLLILQRVRV